MRRALLANKADINQQDEKGYTPLIIATYNGNYDVAQFLLDHGAATEKKDASGRTALMGVSFKGEDREVELLLDHGADPNAKDAHGMTSMMYAVMFGKLSVVKILRANEASKSASASEPATRLNLRRSLPHPIFGVPSMKPTFFALFLAIALYGSAAHAQATNIFDAARADDVKTVQALLDKKADINQVDESGYTALTLASYNGSPNVVALLLKEGASTRSPIRWAAPL